MSRVRRAIAAVAAGRPVVVTHDTAHDNDGYLVFAAEAATPEAARVHRPAHLRVCPRRVARCRVRAAEPAAHVSQRRRPLRCRCPPGDGRLDRYGHGNLGDRSRPHHRGTRRRTTHAASDFRRPGHVVPVEATRTGCWDGRDRPRRRSIWHASRGAATAGVLCDIVSRDHTHRDGPRHRVGRIRRPARAERSSRSTISRRIGGAPNRRSSGWRRRSCRPGRALPAPSASVTCTTAASTWP